VSVTRDPFRDLGRSAALLLRLDKPKPFVHAARDLGEDGPLRNNTRRYLGAPPS
jgi:hypothetical protein